MSNSVDFAVFWSKIAAGLPAAVEAAEILGAALAPGRQTGPAKLDAVTRGLGIASLAAQAAAPYLSGQAAAIELAAVGVINAAVAMRKAFVSGQAAAAATAVTAVETGQPTAPPAPPGPPSPPGGADPAVVPHLAALAAPPAEPVTHWQAGQPVITEIKPGVREVNGVREVWDEVNQAWCTPGR